jgi:FAD/FMN-containing dehydrogenase/Fe-S oxidoreductase
VPDHAHVLKRELEKDLGGEVHFDDLTRTLYATDASIYEITPVGVVVPRDIDDVVAAVRACGRAGLSITPRGAGTGLTGGAVGPGLQIDLSKYFRQIEELDPQGRTVRVGAGVVLDQLNALAAGYGLQFGPDVATSSRATIGGMIANNSCGAHSVIYGRTVDHLVELTCVLADGSVVTWSAGNGLNPHQSSSPTESQPAGGSAAATRIDETLRSVRDRYRAEILARYPKILRRTGGYGLDRLVADEPRIDPATIVCGSEGTLCVVVEAVLRLIPLPKHRALLVAHFDELLGALAETPAILEHRPAAVELADRMLLNAARRDNPQRVASFVTADPAAILIVELYDDDEQSLRERMVNLEQDVSARSATRRCTRVTDPDRQAEVWDSRKRALGLLMSNPGDEQPFGFVEDTAVDPARLRDYIARFDGVLSEHGISQVGYWAHASVGCLHVRPVLNLKRAGDVDRMRSIADAVSDLVLEYGGAMTAEHGDGLVRSCWLEKMYGPNLVRAFGEVKAAFDPDGIMNPGKIVDPWPMTENLRFGARYESKPIRTHLDFSAHGGLAGLAQMCSGVGQCRQRMIGTMCPSYIATGDEKHTTRARANALRVALSNRGLLDGLADPRLEEVMDLCLSCKACKSECPTGVDLARMKAEWLAYRNRSLGVPRRSRLVADTPRLAAWGSRFAPLSNWVMGSAPLRAFFERRYGLDRRIAPSRFARRTFRQWFSRHRKKKPRARDLGAGGVKPAPRGRVVYFADCWTNFYQPQVGIAAVRLLEAAGFDVLVPRLQCCGRPMISKGLLAEAAHLAELNVKRLAFFGDAGVPIVGTEPSCILTLVDEYPQLLRNSDARKVARMAATIDSLLAGLLRDHPGALCFEQTERHILYHGHCHQKAQVGTQDALELLNAPPGFSAREIPSGCCGMAGSFGHEVEHYEVARAIGEERLFPAVRARDGAEIAVSGFSCREQIAHHTGVPTPHLVEYLAEALKHQDSNCG